MAEVVGSPVPYQTPGSAGRRVTISPHPPSGGSRRSPPAGSRISSGHSHRIGTPKTPDDRLSPAPEYMRPMAQSASRRWKRQQEQVMMDQLVDKWELHKDGNRRSRDEARKIVRKIPMEILAKEWLNTEGATVETRAFLVDKVLPTLILGIEKLLVEVDKKDLAETTEPDDNFNPINYLAQYLMRNNPRYSNFSEASPYIRGLRQIAEELKGQLFEYEDNRLARIKAEAKRKREEREKMEQLRQGEKIRREEALRKQFMEWNVGADGKVELALLQNALRSFLEIAEQYPEELRNSAQYSQELEPTDDSGKSVQQFEFSEYLNQFIIDLPSDIFDQFLSHLSRCALTYRTSTQKDARRETLIQVFADIDHNEVGLVDRHRILNLFEMFWDKIPERLKRAMRNPRGWPVVEVDEVSSDFSDVEDEEEPQLIDNNKNVTQETKDTENQEEDSSLKKETDDQKTLTESATEGEQDADITTETEDAKDNKGTEKDEGDTTETVDEAGPSQEESEDTQNKEDEKETKDGGQEKVKENANEGKPSQEIAESQAEDTAEAQDKETEEQEEEILEKVEEGQKDVGQEKNEDLDKNDEKEEVATENVTEKAEDNTESEKQTEQTTSEDQQKEDVDQSQTASGEEKEALPSNEQNEEQSVPPSDEQEQTAGEPVTETKKKKVPTATLR